MGTRNLTMVIHKKQIKVAQYGQWDGYPSGQGHTALEFLRGFDVSKFKDQLEKMSFFTDEEARIEEEKGDAFERMPYLSRDLGADILNAIHYGFFMKNDWQNGPTKIECKVTKLIDESDFAGESLFCEWAYVIDLDQNTFEVYSGFNKSTLTEDDRFKFPEKDTEEYQPISLIKSYSINDLPTDDEFLELEKVEED